MVLARSDTSPPPAEVGGISRPNGPSLPSTDPERLLDTDNERSVVQVRVFDSSVECWRASGVVFPTSEYVVTNSHVVEPNSPCDPSRFEIWVAADGNSSLVFAYEATLEASNILTDVAILRVEALGSNPAGLTPVAAGSSPAIGDELLVLGFPKIGGESLTASKGIASGFLELGGLKWIKTDAASSGGSSGGAALTPDRHLVGLVSQAAASADGEVVDCRLVADTNGDGVVDSRDSCVPVGSGVTLLVPMSTIEALVSRNSR